MKIICFIFFQTSWHPGYNFILTVLLPPANLLVTHLSPHLLKTFAHKLPLDPVLASGTGKLMSTGWSVSPIPVLLWAPHHHPLHTHAQTCTHRPPPSPETLFPLQSPWQAPLSPPCMDISLYLLKNLKCSNLLTVQRTPHIAPTHSHCPSVPSLSRLVTWDLTIPTSLQCSQLLMTVFTSSNPWAWMASIILLHSHCCLFQSKLVPWWSLALLYIHCQKTQSSTTGKYCHFSLLGIPHSEISISKAPYDHRWCGFWSEEQGGNRPVFPWQQVEKWDKL